MLTVLGVDLSLRSTGLVAVPTDWGLDWSRVAHRVAGAELKQDATVAQHVGRLRLIARAAMAFAREHRVTRAWILGYAYNKADMSRAHLAGELGGVVKYALVEIGVEVEVVVESRARTLLGKAPRKDAKVWATERLMRAGAPPSWPQDVLDAFVGANWGLSELGGSALIMRDQLELGGPGAAA